jgi:hypothetical protein
MADVNPKLSFANRSNGRNFMLNNSYSWLGGQWWIWLTLAVLVVVVVVMKKLFKRK